MNADRLFQPIMSLDDLNRFIDQDFPQVRQEHGSMSLLDVQPGETTMRLDPNERHLRPGGTVSGPSLFMLCDVCAYMVILAHLGPAKHTVTTNLNINFMHKSAPGPIDCTARLLKLGKRLAVVDMMMHDQEGLLISQATGTYSIPPKD